MRTSLTIVWLLILSTAISSVYWYTDWQYRRPTPLPAGYNDVRPGTLITLEKDPVKPQFIHFFNPECPCSRFNLRVFKKLADAYHGQLTFTVVIPDNIPLRTVEKYFSLYITLRYDGGLARKCGVYSTPQLVLLDAYGRLFYRGNYNISRYCTDERTNFAAQAVKALLISSVPVPSSPFALKAYGCRLKWCNQKK